MMRPSCNINTSNNFYDLSRELEDYYYYYYSSPSLFPTSPSILHGDGDKNIEAELFQGFLENNAEMIEQQNHLENNNNNYKIVDNSKSKKVGFDKINIPKNKISKKDRHTKIDTAQGPRDRRVRLSLNVARRFFGLQDMLGFDKASKTVEWLLTKSLSDINEVARSFQQLQQHEVGANSSVSPTSEIIEMDELPSTNGNLEKIRPNNKSSETRKPNKKAVRMIRPLGKKSREKARARARERTKEKMMSTLQKRRELAAVDSHGSSLVSAGYWIPSTTHHNVQQNDGIIHELTIPELEHLFGNLGDASIWQHK